MNISLIITDHAREDLLRFYRFYQENVNNNTAVSVMETINKQLTHLANNPLMGRQYYHQEHHFYYRELLIFFGKAKRNCFVALYHYDNDKILVLRIKNAREKNYLPFMQPKR